MVGMKGIYPMMDDQTLILDLVLKAARLRNERKNIPQDYRRCEFKQCSDLTCREKRRNDSTFPKSSYCSACIHNDRIKADLKGINRKIGILSRRITRAANRILKQKDISLDPGSM